MGDQTKLATQASAETGPRQHGATLTETEARVYGVCTPRVIKWIPVERELPDAETTVLIHVPHGNEPVWLGFLDDGGGWCDVDGSYIRNKVTHWAQLPEGPQ